MKKHALLLMSLLAAVSHADANAQTPNPTDAPAVTRPRTVAGTRQDAAPQTPARDAAAPPAGQGQDAPRQNTNATQTPAASQTPTNRTQTGAPAVPPVTSTLPPPSQTSPAAPAVVPVYTPAPLQPARPLGLVKARTRIAETQRLMKTRLTPTAFTSTSLVTIAALDQESSQVHMLTFPKQTLLTKGADVLLTSSLGTQLRLRIVRPNYVNTSVVVADTSGRQLTPLLVEYPIEKFGRFREMAYYTSAHPALVSPEVVKAGQAYVRSMLDLAHERLKSKGVHIAPALVDIAERLCVVEHVDHQRFLNENRLAIYEEVYALYALNELDTYRYSVSSAGAGGMVQMIPSTYQILRRLYPGVGLNPDFVAGMRNHGNALEAMLLYIQMTWNELQADPDASYAYKSGLATQAELIAAGYNSNPSRLGGRIRRGGTNWRTAIPRETQMYLQIYKSFESLVQLKTRAS
ncbi:MAG TPA: hypothetical protein VER08_10710 [Pyrinomonadaceae bacterium]|nr:hypothetical protein [Pyrinomonadaceae bacterium]